MADSVIGALRVLLGVDTAAFSEGLGKAEGLLSKFARSIDQNFGKIIAGAGLGAITTGIAATVKSSINHMDELGKTAQKIGIPVEKLSSLELAAKLSDVSVEALGKSMGKLSTAMVTAASGGAAPATSAFQALGISMDVLKSNDPSKVLEVMAERFSGMQDGATKTALANAILGQRMGRELIPLLNQGSQALKEARENAEAFGLVVSEKTSKQAEKFNDNLKLLGEIPRGIGNEIAKVLLPSLVSLSNQFVAWAKNNDVVRVSADYLLRTLAFLVDNLKLLGTVLAVFLGIRIGLFFVQLALTVYQFAVAIYASATAVGILNAVISKNFIVTILSMAGTIVIATGVLDGLIEKGKEWAGKVGGLLPDNITAKIAAGLESIGVKTRALGGNVDGLKTHGDEAAESMRNLKPPPAFDPASSANAVKFNEELLKIGLRAKEMRGDFDQLAPGFVQAATSLKLIKDTGDGFSGTLDTLTPKQLALNNALLGLQAAGMIKDSQQPMEEYAQRIERITQLQDMQAISAQVAADQSAKAFEKMSSAYATAAATALGGFSSLFMQFGQHNKKMFEVGKAFAIAEAIVNTYKSAVQAQAQPPGPPFSYVYVAGAIAAGLANVMKITSQKAPTFAMGGSMTLGGVGGLDSKLVQMMMTPGERVTVDQNKYGEGASVKTVTVAGIKPKDYFSGDVLRDLIENINTAIGDGYKIKVAT